MTTLLHLVTLVTLAVVYAYFTRPRVTPPSDTENSKRERRSQTRVYATLRSLIVVAAAVPIAILTNALRVSGTGVLAHYYGTRIADGFFHSFSGWVIYIVAALLLFATGWSLDRIMKFSFASIRLSQDAQRKVSSTPNQVDVKA